MAYGRVMMIGPGGAGKTSLWHALMNKKLPSSVHTSSTLLAELLELQYMWAEAGDEVTKPWVELSEEDELDELAFWLKRRVEHRCTQGESQPLGEKPSLSPSEMVRGHSQAIEEQIKQIIEEILTRLSNGKPLKKSEVFMHLWDCGGQVVFLDVMSAFLTLRTVYMLVFDASKDLNDKLDVDSVKEGEIVGTEPSHLSTTEMLLQWMAFIHVLLRLRKQETRPMQAKAPQSGQVMLVGTHKDELKSRVSEHDELQRKIKDQLHLQYEDRASSDLLIPEPIYIVDNTTAGNGELEDPVLKKIREQVHRVILKNFSVPTPVSWVFFRRVMKRLFVSQRVVKYEEVVAIAKACWIQSEAVPKVLAFYHQLGVFLHYADVPSLKGWVIVHPQWFLWNLVKLLCPHGLQEDHGKERMWNLLRKKGILVQELYESVLSGNEVPPQALIDLLVHLHLAAPVPPQPSISHYKAPWYFVPCMLSLPARTASTQKASGRKQVCVAADIHLKFSTKYTPPGYFVRLVAYLAQREFEVLYENIDRYHIRFRWGQVDELYLKEESDTLLVRVSRYKDAQRLLQFQNTCREVLKTLLTAVDEIKSWLPSVEVFTAFRCSHCSEIPEHHVNFGKDTSTSCCLRCDREEYFEPSFEQKYWLKTCGDTAMVNPIGEY